MTTNKLPLLILGCATTAISANAATAPQQPNIVMLFADDLGWADLGYVNPQFQTPNIDKLQQEGTYFSRAYVSTATSSPSRASLLTGKEALRCGFTRHIYDDNDEGEFQSFVKDPRQMLSRAWLPSEETTYAERLKETGYHTTHVGKWHLGYEEYFPQTQGFDEVIATAKYGHPKSYYSPFFVEGDPYPDATKEDYLTDMIASSTSDYIRQYDQKSPLLLNVWFYGVHGPHIGRKDLVEKYKKLGFSTQLAKYHAMVETLDSAVGKIRKALEESGMAENTIIVFSSDQGGAFSNYPLSGGKMGGNTLGEGGTRVPLIVYDPTSKPRVYGDPVQNIDLYPTFVEYATGKKCADKQINGVSLIPVVEGKSLKSRDLFLHRSYEDQHCAIINGDWKLISYTSGKLQLFNIASDESETTNLINVYPELTKEMAARLDRWFEEAAPKEILTK